MKEKSTLRKVANDYLTHTRKNAGITLIALVITIVVLLILAGVSIGMLTGENGILTQAGKAKEKTDRATKIEQEQLDDVAGMMNNYEDSYNKSKGCNIPKLTTGMTPVNYNSTKGTWEKCSTENWDWEYIDQESNTTDGSEGNVGTSKWANAMTEDGSLWVWIPRYAYKITSGYHSATAGEIDVKFLVGTTNKDGDGNSYSTTYDMTVATTNEYMSDFVVHPTFTTNLEQGGWSAETTGFWVAKFEAGYVGSENANADKSSIDMTNVKYSSVKYTSNKFYDLTTQYGNIYGDTIPNETRMSYPIFKENVFSYTNVSIGDAFGLAQSLNEQGNPYGFSINCNTHMMKNSEWGAVAYLTQSKYGRNGTEVSLNNYLVPNGNTRPTSMSTTFCAKTGYGAVSSPTASSSNTDVALYNTEKGALASSTGNVYGVYDLCGGAYEYVSSYAEGLNDAGHGNYKSTDEYYAEYGGYLLAETNKKYKSILSIDSNYATAATNIAQMANYSTHNNIFGDAMWETSMANDPADLTGNAYAKRSWNSDYSLYPYGVNAFLSRGGKMSGGPGAGVFYFGNSSGYLNNALAFRACVVSPD